VFEPKVKVSKALYAQLAACAEKLGYSSAAEFAVHILEQAVEQAADADTEEEVRKRLQGLGYLG